MPSLDELIATSHGGSVTPDAPDDVLAAVKAEGGRRRARRHRRNAFVAALGLVVLAVPAFALLSDGDDDQQLTVAADDRSTTTTTDATPTTAATTTQTTAITDETVVVAPPETATTVPGRTGPPAVPRTTVPTVVCRNSTTPLRFGRQREPRRLVRHRAGDRDRRRSGHLRGRLVGSRRRRLRHRPLGQRGHGRCPIERRFGPWTPPPAQPGSGRVSFTETFAAAGTYRIVVDLWTGNVCDHPHASEAHVVTTITVADAPPPSSG